mmetsp:Transcript_30049/g.33675  ORF Transcript_30049/g.33675 Transcript_30049/m.33675 type:complete len:119 (+) Transcript_30049:123-479(+)
MIGMQKIIGVVSPVMNITMLVAYTPVACGRYILDKTTKKKMIIAVNVFVADLTFGNVKSLLQSLLSCVSSLLFCIGNYCASDDESSGKNESHAPLGTSALLNSTHLLWLDCIHDHVIG